MKVNREEVLKSLISLTPGLASRELIEQSSCFVVTEDGRMMTFNDEVCASRKSSLPIKGAVKAKLLLDHLSKLPEEVIDMEQVGNSLRIKGKGRRAEIKMESAVLLPVESVDVPEEWRPLATEFLEAVGMVHSCASTEESAFVLTCVHIHPDYVESSDRFQIARYECETGVEESMLVRAESIQKMLASGMSEICETKSWVHFRNSDGLTISIRRYLETYPVLGKHLNSEGTVPITLPGELEEAVNRAADFSGDNKEAGNNHILLHIDLDKDEMRIKGIGVCGRYEEKKAVAYDGPPIRFLIASVLLTALGKRSKDCRVSAKKFFVDSGKFQYASSTRVAETPPKADAQKDA